ncbi:MAG TPA: hypothetical protein VK498_04535 [Ferruginibacter sp.]|nr:hypothetical protein [Ferruginibacter sp.]
MSLVNTIGIPFRGEHYVIYEVNVCPYTTKQLCQLYTIDHKTFLKWIQPFKEDIGERRGNLYTVLQVEIIFMKLGIPYMIREKG